MGQVCNDGCGLYVRIGFGVEVPYLPHFTDPLTYATHAHVT